MNLAYLKKQLELAEMFAAHGCFAGARDALRRAAESLDSIESLGATRVGMPVSNADEFSEMISETMHQR